MRTGRPIAAAATVALAAIIALLLPLAPPATAQTAPQDLTLEQIMADADWLGNPPENPFWAADGRSVYYQRKHEGEDYRDLYRLDLATGKSELVPAAELSRTGAPDAKRSRDLRWETYVREGDVFLRDRQSGEVRQITRTAERELTPIFMKGDRQIAFLRGNNAFVYDIDSGLLSQATDIRLDDDPADKDKEDGYLDRQQERLFDVIRQREARDKDKREHDKALQKEDPTRPPLPFYLGKNVEISGWSFAPSGDYMVLVTQPKASPSDAPLMPRYVTEDGLVKTEEVRPKVAAFDPPNQSVVFLDLRAHEQHDLDLSSLSGMQDDPLKELREKAEARRKAEDEKEKAEKGTTEKKVDKKEPAREKKGKGKEDDEDGTAKKDEKPKTRGVDISTLLWSDDGSHLAVQLYSHDNKDGWIVSVEPAKSLTPVLVERLNDPAWVLDYGLNDLGWLPDNSTLFFLSEKSGYSQLYLDTPGGKPRQLSPAGKYEVSAPVVTHDGRYLYYTANSEHPGKYDTWRVEVATGKAEQLTHLGGLTEAVLSPDESQLLLLHSSIARHDELYLQPAQPLAGAEARQLTQTHSQAFLAQSWTMPEVVAIPSTHVKAPLYSRVYVPPGFDPSKKYPAVVFTHGAGYLQNAHYGWSSYFREFMFNSLLTQHGYVVLDMDYRASAGYGRDWRTAIYRQMGHPEVEDLKDGVAWLVANRGVDPARVGTYGGSYGGFLTMMSLFREPDLFAAGAALRPVTDWAHYNYDYTSNILNTPDVDPEAYEQSSPIEFAAGLRKPLLICTGVEDNNVLFQDSVRLVQRLIELKNPNFQIAIYPVESHGFREAASWLDEYRRIFKLFETNLK